MSEFTFDDLIDSSGAGGRAPQTNGAAQTNEHSTSSLDSAAEIEDLAEMDDFPLLAPQYDILPTDEQVWQAQAMIGDAGHNNLSTGIASEDAGEIDSTTTTTTTTTTLAASNPPAAAAVVQQTNLGQMPYTAADAALLDSIIANTTAERAAASNTSVAPPLAAPAAAPMVNQNNLTQMFWFAAGGTGQRAIPASNAAEMAPARPDSGAGPDTDAAQPRRPTRECEDGDNVSYRGGKFWSHDFETPPPFPPNTEWAVRREKPEFAYMGEEAIDKEYEKYFKRRAAAAQKPAAPKKPAAKKTANKKPNKRAKKA